MRSIKQLSFFIVFIVSLSFTACNNETAGNATETITTADSLTKATPPIVFDLLIGTWQSHDGKSFEQWTKNDNGSFRSVAFSIKGTDTSWNEQASIYPENDKWVFENTVKGQNDAKAVKFVSTLLTEKTVQFSNPAHDFPTDINYTIPDANTVNAFIIGPNSKGGKDTIPFNYTRKK
jgi:hypothetical protein